MTIRDTLLDWLRLLTEDGGADIRYAEDLALLSVAGAEEADVLGALDVLWPLTRFRTREECWELLTRDDLEQSCLREEIRMHLAGEGTRQATLKALSGVWEREREAKRPRERRLSALVEARRQRTGDGPERHLPSWSDDPDSEMSADTPTEIAEHFRRGFPFLSRLSEMLAPAVGSQSVFMAVLGPLHDALSWRRPEGFAKEIDEARLAMVGRRVHEGTADLHDAWRWFRSRTEDAGQREAANAVIRIAEHVPIAELEMFFAWWAYADDDEGQAIVTPEVLLPDPERLWLRILRRPTMSLGLLQRAGEFFWENADDRRGPAEALAALALRWETEFDFAEITWAVFWKAFEDAAARAKWDLAMDCLNGALFHVGGRARGRPDGLAGQIEEYGPDTEHVEECCLRFFDDRDHSPRFLLWWAWSGIRESSILRDTRLGRSLQRIGQLMNLEVVGLGIALPERLGHDLWESLMPDTRLLLLEAEELWVAKEHGVIARGDYGVIGAQFRRAVEHEWRVRLRGVPGLSEDQLGRIIGNLREFGSVGWALLRQRFGPNSRLANRRFLEDAQTLCSRWLNAGAHGGVLDRSWAQELRRRLWDEGWLKELLGAVQPRT